MIEPQTGLTSIHLHEKKIYIGMCYFGGHFKLQNNFNLTSRFQYKPILQQPKIL